MRSGALRLLQCARTGLDALEAHAVQSAVQAAMVTRPAGTTSLTAVRSLAAAAAAPAFSVPVSGDGAGVLAHIESILGPDGSAGHKCVSDAAVALAYLGARGNRRLWGKVLEKAASLRDSFDGASLSNLFWALSTANVAHGRTIAELAGPLAANLKSMTPAQISYAVEAMGKAGYGDVELTAAVAELVAGAKGADFSGADLARLLWGAGAGGANDGKLVKAASAGLARAANLDGRSAAQALWGLAALKRAPDAALLGALTKALKAGVEAPADAAAAAWALATLVAKPDAATVRALSDKAKAGASELSTAQAIQGGWGLAMLGDKDGAGALLGAAAAAISKDPTAVSPTGLALLHAAAVVSGTSLPGGVSEYAAKGFGLAAEHARHTRGSAAAAFHAEVAEAAAYANGARHRPDIADKVASYKVAAPDGSTLDVVVAEGNAKTLIMGVEWDMLSSNGSVLGGALAASRVREAQGYRVVRVPQSSWPTGAPLEQRAAALSAAARK